LKELPRSIESAHLGSVPQDRYFSQSRFVEKCDSTAFREVGIFW